MGNLTLWGQTWVPAGGRAVTLDREDIYVTDRLFRHNMFYTVAGATEGADMGSDQETNPGIDLATFHLAMESKVEDRACLPLGPCTGSGAWRLPHRERPDMGPWPLGPCTASGAR